MRYNYQLEQPEGKSNCLVWLYGEDKSIPAYWHVKKQCFIGRYGVYQGKELVNIQYWQYEIIASKLPQQVEESLVLLNMRNGQQEFTIEYGKLDKDEQKSCMCCLRC